MSMANQADWYRLAKHLQNEDATVTAIELLPGSGEEWYTGEGDNPHKPFLLSEGHLGIPEKVLYRAYAEAVRRHPSFRACPLEGPIASDALLCSSVILLLNPDHNSALNYRKRVVRDGHISAAFELAYSSLSLMIPRNSKSSILWHHRRWLLEKLHPFDGPEAASTSLEWPSSLPLETCGEELAVVSQACERYRRNYYAWQHRAFILQLIHRNISCKTSADKWTEMLRNEYRRSTEWLESHISDHSAAQYLCQIQKVVIELHVNVTTHSDIDTSIIFETAPWPIPYTLSLVRYYPDHETLWLALRMACHITNSLHTERSDLEDSVTRMFPESRGEDGDGQVERNELTEMKARGCINALRFLVWCRLQTGQIFVDESLARRVLAVEDVASAMGCASQVLPS